MINTPRTDAAYIASTGAGIYELFKESQDIERELAAAQQRIQRLEEVGDWMRSHSNNEWWCEKWDKAKEAKL